MSLMFRNAPKSDRWRELEQEARGATTLMEAMRLLEEADRLRRRDEASACWTTPLLRN